MNETVLIRTLSTRDNYERFEHLVKEYAVTPETNEIIREIGRWFKDHEDETEIDWTNFMSWLRVCGSRRLNNEQVDALETIINNAAAQTPDPSIIKRLRELSFALDIHDLTDDVIAGTKSLDKVRDLIEDWEATALPAEEEPDEFDLDDVFSVLERTGGLRWRLPELNVSVGPLAKGDLVIVGKRPEVGGTTFLTSELTHMVSQLNDGERAIIFNNEESVAKVRGRVIQSALEYTTLDMVANKKRTMDEYKKFLGTRHIDIVHDTNLTVRDIERQLRKHEYKIIGINVLWKVRMTGRIEDYQKYERLCQWARTLADEHAPVIAIWQADASAEGEAWPDQSKFYGSKTGLQGEADVLAMIGKVHEPGKEFERYVKVWKNKLPGGPGVNPKLRHGAFTVDIDPERGRFNGRMI